MNPWLFLLFAFATSSCDRSPDQCASVTELTARIGEQVYQVPAGDRPTLEAIDAHDVFALTPSRDLPSEHLIHCQRKGKVPVALRTLQIRPPALKPQIVQISVSNEQLERKHLPSIESVLALPWNSLDGNRTEQIHDRRFRLGATASVIEISCNHYTGRDFQGRIQPMLCETRMRMGPSVLRLHFEERQRANEVRRLIADTANYLRSIEVSSR